MFLCVSVCVYAGGVYICVCDGHGGVVAVGGSGACEQFYPKCCNCPED